MIKVHHLNNSRALRILWLLEEIGAPYEIVKYQRGSPMPLAPPELKAVHPLGKSPVIEDNGMTIAESAAIVEYLIDTYGQGRFRPKPGTSDYWEYLQWMHFAEGSAMLPVLLALYVGRLGEAGAPLFPRITGELANHLGYMDAALAGKDYLLGSDFSAADIQLAFVIEAAEARGYLRDYPNLLAYQARYRARPAWSRAVEKGGPFALPRQAPLGSHA